MEVTPLGATLLGLSLGLLPRRPEMEKASACGSRPRSEQRPTPVLATTLILVALRGPSAANTGAWVRAAPGTRPTQWGLSMWWLPQDMVEVVWAGPLRS